jgi:hypothetical protein
MPYAQKSKRCQRSQIISDIDGAISQRGATEESMIAVVTSAQIMFHDPNRNFIARVSPSTAIRNGFLLHRIQVGRSTRRTMDEQVGGLVDTSKRL